MLRHFTFCFFVLFTNIALSQEPKQPVRLEIPLNSEYTETEVIPAPDSTLLVYIKQSNTWNTEAKFHFTKYNHNLKEIWKSEPELPADISFIRHYTEYPYIYFVFNGERFQEYTFVKLNLNTGQINSSVHKLENVDAIYEFNVLEGKYFMIAKGDENEKPLLLYLNPNQGDVKILPAVYGGESSFSDMHTDHNNGQVDIVMTESNGRISRLQVKSFDASGNLLNNYFVHQQDDKSLLNAEISPIDSTQKILFGVYGLRDLRYINGFFSLPVPSSTNIGDFYSVLQLQNFLKYMNPRREKRIRHREAKRLAEGKDLVQRYRILLHDLITTPTGYILAGEAYYPQYSTISSYTALERSSLNNGPNVGYKRTHAIALKFDKEGNLLWDNCFPLNNVSTSDLVHALKVAHAPDNRVVMAYPLKGKIVYHLMEEGKFDNKEHETDLKLNHKNDKLVFTEHESLTSWYSGNFAAYGFQRVKPHNTAPHTVFYINKVSF